MYLLVNNPLVSFPRYSTTYQINNMAHLEVQEQINSTFLSMLTQAISSRGWILSTAITTHREERGAPNRLARGGLSVWTDLTCTVRR